MRKSGSLLIVEDERVLRRCLEKHFCGRGMEVRVAGTLSEARALLVESDFDAALLDVGLPDGDGLSLLPKLSLDSSVVITADPDFDRLEELGVKHVVPKPIDLDTVARVVDALTLAKSRNSRMKTSTDRVETDRPSRELPCTCGDSQRSSGGMLSLVGSSIRTVSSVDRHARCSCRSTMPNAQSSSKGKMETAKRPLVNGNHLERCSSIGLAKSGPLRIMFYSHDTVGLGHFRRNLVLARALSEIEPRPSILMISGCAETSRFEMPAGVDVLTLPALRKVGCGEYASRSLDVSLKDLIAIRSEAIQAAARSFRPDLVIVDNVPRGAERELDATLADLRKKPGVHVVLGLRDVLDEPQAVARDWARSANADAISEFFDSIWVYGDPRVADHEIEYGFDESICEKIEYVGYLDRSSSVASGLPMNGVAPRAGRPYVLCLVGGGEDGSRLAEAFSQIEHRGKMTGLLLLGPFMPAAVREKLHLLALGRPDLSVVDFVVDPIELIRDAECVITMGGYNSVSEVLSFERPALVVPRVEPRREQWLRAHKLAKLGLVDVCELNELSPNRLEGWIATAPTRSSWGPTAIDMGGLRRVREIVESVGRKSLSAGQEQA